MKGPHQIFQPTCTLQKPFTVDELLQTVQRALVGFVRSSPVPIQLS